MADSESPNSPLEAAVGAASPRAVEAFSILGNETRLSILLALWEAYKPYAEDNAVSFSELRERLGNPDSGQFNYHLDKLAGHFVEKTDAGYKLRTAGHELVRTVIGGTGIEDPTLERTELDEEADELADPTGSAASCSRCGAPTEVTYQDNILSLECTECEGNIGDGGLAGRAFDPAGLVGRTPEQAWNASFICMRHDALSAIEGVCPRCSGQVDTSLHICEDHASDGVCDNCGLAFALRHHAICRVCKWAGRGGLSWILAMHPDVLGFYNERGVPLQYASDAAHLPEDADQELVSEDPLRVQVTYECDGDRLEVLVDEELNVLEVTEPD